MTGQHPYLIAQVLNELVLRCRRLGLRVGASERETLVQAAALVASLTMRFLRRGHPEYMR